MDEAGQDVARWDIDNAWPSKYEVSSFDADANEVAIETLELQNEGIKRVKAELGVFGLIKKGAGLVTSVIGT
jgi:hypothetical protein